MITVGLKSSLTCNTQKEITCSSFNFDWFWLSMCLRQRHVHQNCSVFEKLPSADFTSEFFNPLISVSFKLRVSWLQVCLTLGCSPPPGPVVYVLDLADRLISKAGPFAAAGIMVGSIYWTAVTYGAVTVMQVWPVIPPERFSFRIGLFCPVRTLTLTLQVMHVFMFGHLPLYISANNVHVLLLCSFLWFFFPFVSESHPVWLLNCSFPFWPARLLSRWWAIRRAWMLWSGPTLCSCSLACPPSLSCWSSARWSAGRTTSCVCGGSTPTNCRSSTASSQVRTHTHKYINLSLCLTLFK